MCTSDAGTFVLLHLGLVASNVMSWWLWWLMHSRIRRWINIVGSQEWVRRMLALSSSCPVEHDSTSSLTVTASIQPSLFYGICYKVAYDWQQLMSAGWFFDWITKIPVSIRNGILVASLAAPALKRHVKHHLFFKWYSNKRRSRVNLLDLHG